MTLGRENKKRIQAIFFIITLIYFISASLVMKDMYWFVKMILAPLIFVVVLRILETYMHNEGPFLKDVWLMLAFIIFIKIAPELSTALNSGEVTVDLLFGLLGFLMIFSFSFNIGFYTEKTLTMIENRERKEKKKIKVGKGDILISLLVIVVIVFSSVLI